jgi:hypothetical protein
MLDMRSQGIRCPDIAIAIGVKKERVSGMLMNELQTRLRKEMAKRGLGWTPAGKQFAQAWMDSQTKGWSR